MPEPEPPLEEQPEEDSVQEPEEELDILGEAAEPEPAVSEAEFLRTKFLLKKSRNL